ncbi:MAG TPA: hypothetical protein VFO18_07325 [Methylomirabilota bacterium]|nr:hypothetical protein [Methylomirabilota bacterium]
MAGLEIPLIIPLALGAGIVFLLVLAIGVSVGVTERATRAFWCPFRECSVSAEFEQAVWDGKRVDVASCSAFTPPTVVACDKACLRLRKLASKPKSQSVAVDHSDPWRRDRTSRWEP